MDGAKADDERKKPAGCGAEADSDCGREEDLPRKHGERAERAFERGTEQGLAAFVGAGDEFAAKRGEHGGGFGPRGEEGEEEG